MTISKTPFSVVALGYVLSPDRDHALLLYHNAKPNDPSYGKFNGLSGPVSPTESVFEAMNRIVREETGAIPTHLRYRGNVHWSRFGQSQESVLGNIFLIEGLDRNPPLKNTPNGQLHWIRIDEMLNGDRPIWAGDEHFLPLVFDLDPRPFHGFMPYEHGVPRSWSFDRTL